MVSHVTISLDSVSFQLKEDHDFGWLKELGEIFCVFDQQDSGNLSFGINKDGEKRFVKYAGARPIEFSGDPESAIEQLKSARKLYSELAHPHLVKLRQAFEVNQGYAMEFDWFDGECLHSHWSFPPPEKYSNPNSPFYRFRQLPIKERLNCFQTVLNFHVCVEKKGYVAVDFYDGSILYDFKRNETVICDIDYYQEKPFLNTMGKLWGSQRFMSPEEQQKGAPINEQTNVFNMGATAFVLLGGELDRSESKWEADQSLYKIALKAVENKPEMRFKSVSELAYYWNKGCFN